MSPTKMTPDVAKKKRSRGKQKRMYHRSDREKEEKKKKKSRNDEYVSICRRGWLHRSAVRECSVVCMVTLSTRDRSSIHAQACKENFRRVPRSPDCAIFLLLLNSYNIRQQGMSRYYIRRQPPCLELVEYFRSEHKAARSGFGVERLDALPIPNIRDKQSRKT